MKVNKLTMRWSMVAAVSSLLFWSIWRWINGSVPMIEYLKLTDKNVVTLPIGISLWWSILLAVILAIWLTHWRQTRAKESDPFIFLGCSIAYGLAIGVLLGTVLGLANLLGVAFFGFLILVSAGIMTMFLAYAIVVPQILGTIAIWFLSLAGLAWAADNGLNFHTGFLAGTGLGLLVGLIGSVVLLLKNNLEMIKNFMIWACDWLLANN